MPSPRHGPSSSGDRRAEDKRVWFCRVRQVGAHLSEAPSGKAAGVGDLTFELRPE